MAVSPYSTLNLRSGRVLTSLPVVGWEGRGPSVSFSLYHNMTSAIGVIPIESGSPQGLMGDANGDGELDLADVDPFLEILLSPEPTEQQVAIADFTGDAVADSDDVDAFAQTLGFAIGGPLWSHSYSMNLVVQTDQQGNTTATLTRDDGTTDKFMLYQGSFLSPPGVYEKLVENADGSYTLTSKNQWRTHFTAAGKLDWIADATVQEESPGVPMNRVQCTYSDGSHGPAGKLWKVTDAAGRVLELGYNANGELGTIKDPVNRTWTLMYYDEGAPMGWSADGPGYFVALEDPAGQTIWWLYTADDEIWAFADKNWETYWFEYSGGRLEHVTDPLGLLQSFYYFGTMNGYAVARYTDRRGSDWEYWFRTSVTVLLGGQWRQLPTGNLAQIINPLGESVAWEYQDIRSPEGTGPSNYNSNWYLPHRHEVTRRRNAVWKWWEYTYHPEGVNTVALDVLNRGNLATVQDPLDNTWSLEYDTTNGLNNLIAYTTPGDGGGPITTEILYESTGIDPTVPTKTILAEDQFGSMAEVTISYWGEEYAGYARGKPHIVTDANGAQTRLRYDSKGQLLRVEEGPVFEPGTWDKIFSFTNRDKLGRVINARQYGERVSYTINQADENPCQSPTYCPADGIKIEFDSCTCSIKVTCVCTESFGGPCPDKEADCSNGGTSGQIEESVTTGYTIPGMCPLWGVPRYGGFGLPEIRGETEMERDAVGRPTIITVLNGSDSSKNDDAPPDSSETFEYDGLGRVLVRTIATKEARLGGGDGTALYRNFTFGYDDVNGVYTRTGPDGQTTTTEDDVAGQVVGVERRAAGGALLLSADYTYYETGRVHTITYGNGSAVEYEYDDDERITIIRHRVSQNGAILLQMGYFYTARSLIQEIDESDESGSIAETTFTYDQRGRLIEEWRVGASGYRLQYEYDPGGNRQIKRLLDPDPLNPVVLQLTDYHYDTDDEMVDCDDNGSFERPAADCYMTKNNRLMFYETTGADGLVFERVDYQYETTRPWAGNPTYIVRTVEDPQGEPVHYGYTLQYNNNAELWFITLQTWTGQCDFEEAQLVSCHEFRASGRAMRLTTERDLSDLNSVVDGSRIWHDYDGGQIYADAGVGITGPESPVVTELASHQSGMGQYNYLTSATAYYHGNQIGTLRTATNGQGQDLGRLLSTAFGEIVSASLTPQASSRYKYAGAWGYQMMPEFTSGFSSGFGGAPGDEVPFVHVGYRWYDPATGRFLQRDPIGIRGGLNVYTYTQNGPLANVDPLGLDDCKPGKPGETPDPGGDLACQEACQEWAKAQLCGVKKGLEDCMTSCSHGWWPPGSPPQKGFAPWPDPKGCPPCESGVPSPEQGRPKKPIPRPKNLPVNPPPPAPGCGGGLFGSAVIPYAVVPPLLRKRRRGKRSCHSRLGGEGIFFPGELHGKRSS